MNDVVFMLEKNNTQNLDMGTSRFTEVSMRLFGLSLGFIGLYEDSINCIQKRFFFIKILLFELDKYFGLRSSTHLI